MNSPNPSAPELKLKSTQVEARCDEHGPYTATVHDMTAIGGRVVTTHCPACQARDAKAKADADLQRTAMQRGQEVRRLLGRAGIPPRFQDRTFGNYTATSMGQRAALVTCRTFAETWGEQVERGGSLVLTGGPGTGKTHLACAVAGFVAREFLAAPWFGTVTQLLRHIKDTYRRDSDRSEQSAIDDLVSPDLLIVDEVGVQTGSDHEKMLIFEVLNERYQNLRPTILISNLNSTDLEAYIGQRIMDRFRECGSVVAFDWQSHRGRNAA